MNGHNPKTNHQSDDFQNVIALLQELPRVSVPADFNASLKARIAAAKAESHEFADITGLLKELPRVSAPSDFDFKLRARIAQAKSEQQKASAGWFAELFGRSFSWLQASAAMAAVAIVVSAVTFGVLRSDDGVSTPNNPATVAMNVEKPEANTTAQPNVVIPSVPETNPVRTQRNYTPAPINVAATSRPLSSRNIKYSAPIPEIKRPDVPVNNTSTAIASKVMIKHQSGQSRMVNLSEYNLGLQTAHRTNTGTEAALANIF